MGHPLSKVENQRTFARTVDCSASIIRPSGNQNDDKMWSD